MYSFISLFWWIILGLIVFLIWHKTTEKKEGKEKKVSLLTILFAIILTVIINSLFFLIWDDIGKTARGELGQYNLPQEIVLKGIIMHSFFAIPLIIIALVGYFWLYKKGIKYLSLIMPYLISSIFITLMLIIDIGSYVINEYKRTGIYIILVILAVIFSGIVFFVQQKWEKDKNKEITG